MAGYLKHIKTGEIYPFNPDLALNELMVPYEKAPEGFAAAAKPAPKRRQNKAKAKAPVKDPVAAPTPEPIFDEDVEILELGTADFDLE